jgi:hypothetical protein
MDFLQIEADDAGHHGGEWTFSHAGRIEVTAYQSAYCCQVGACCFLLGLAQTFHM